MISAMNSFIGQIFGNLAALFTSDGKLVRADSSTLNLDGRWIDVNQPHAHTGSPFKVICYNVLGPKHGVGAKHHYSPMEDRQWLTRKDRLLREIDGYDADIVCLQELTANTFRRDFEPHMSAQGYQCGFKLKYRRESLPKAFDIEMLLAPGMFIRRSRFEVVELRSTLISTYLADVERHLSCDLPEKFRHDIREKNNLMQLCLLKDKLATDDDKMLIVVNAHLHWDPREMDIKAAQALALQVAVAEFIKEKKLNRDKVAVMICGDFNSMEIHQRQFCAHASEELSAQTPTGGVYEFMRQGKLGIRHPEHPASFRHGHHMHRIPNFVSPLGPFMPTDHVTEETRYTATTKTDTFAGRIDFIFVEEAVAVQQVLALPLDDDNLYDFAPIPNAQYASDHLALGAVVAIRNA